MNDFLDFWNKLLWGNKGQQNLHDVAGRFSEYGGERQRPTGNNSAPANNPAPVLQQGYGPRESTDPIPLPSLPSPKSAPNPYDLARSERIRNLQGILRSDYGGLDQQNPLYTGIQNSFNGMQDAVDRARQSTNDNFSNSNNAIAGMYDTAVRQIKGGDANQIRQNGADFNAAIGKNYGDVISQVTADKNAEAQKQAEIMQRYGLTDSQMSPQSERNELLDSLVGRKASALNQAETYNAADLARNMSMAQAVGAEGLERRGDLRQQLDQILGSLGDKSAEIEMNRQNALRGYATDDYKQFLDTRSQAGNQLQNLLDSQEKMDFEREQAALKQQNGSMSADDVILRNIGYEKPNELKLLLAKAQTDTNDPYDSLGGQNYEDFLKRYAVQHAAEVGIDPRDNNFLVALNAYVNGRKSYGTDKQTAR